MEYNEKTLKQIKKCKELYNILEYYIYKNDDKNDYNKCNLFTTELLTDAFTQDSFFRISHKTHPKNKRCYYGIELRFNFKLNKDFDIKNINKYEVVMNKKEIDKHFCKNFPEDYYITFKEKPLGQQVIDCI